MYSGENIASPESMAVSVVEFQARGYKLFWPVHTQAQGKI